MSKIFQTKLNTTRIGDLDYDAKLISSGDSNKWPYYFSNPNLYDLDLLPPRIILLANFNIIDDWDIPFTDSGIFIFSKKLINIFREFDDIHFTEVPVIMVNDTHMSSEIIDKNGNLNPSVPTNNNFMALRFNELKSYFDFKNSVYKVPRSNPNGATRIKKLVLNLPKNGFPSLFRTLEKSQTIFVRQDLKSKIENSKISGWNFEEVEFTDGN